MSEVTFRNVTVNTAEGDDKIYADLIKSFMEANTELLSRHQNEQGLVRSASMFDVLSHTLGCLIANIPSLFQDLSKGMPVTDILTAIVGVALHAAIEMYDKKNEEGSR